MSKSTSIRLDNDHEQALDQMVEDGEADSGPEALRQTSLSNLARRGYLTPEQRSPLVSALDTVGLACGVFGVVWLAVAFFYPVEVRIYAVAFMLASILAYTGKWVLTRATGVGWLSRLVGRGEKA